MSGGGEAVIRLSWVGKMIFFFFFFKVSLSTQNIKHFWPSTSLEPKQLDPLRDCDATFIFRWKQKDSSLLNHLVSRNWFFYPHTLYGARQLPGAQQIFEELMNEYTKTCWRTERLSIKLKTLKGNLIWLLLCPLLLPQYYRENSISLSPLLCACSE